MVLAWLPKGVEPLHPVPAHEDILKRVVERVADMQRARHVGWRDHDGKGFITACVCASLEGPAVFPSLVNTALGLGRVKGLFHRHRIASCVKNLSETL